jgi:hypothetical protein
MSRPVIGCASVVLDRTAVGEPQGLQCGALWPLHSTATSEDALARESIQRFRKKVCVCLD